MSDTSNLTGDPMALPVIVDAGDVEQIKQRIQKNYGIEVTDHYAADLIAFVDSFTKQEPDHEPGE